MRFGKFIVCFLWLFLLCPAVITGQISEISPANCERFRHEIDEALVSMNSEKDSLLIFILRPGPKENSKKLRAKRIASIESFIKSRSAQFSRYVIAEAPKNDGPGKLEIYVSGRLVSELYIKRNSVLGSDCSGEPY